MKNTLSHDQLHSKCFLWLWNTHPELRGLFHTNFNDIKIVEHVLRAVSGKSIGNDARKIILSQLKSIGLVPGTWDFEIFYGGHLYFIEFKVGTDKVSPEQTDNQVRLLREGARFFEVRTEKEFILAVQDILNNTYEKKF